MGNTTKPGSHVATERGYAGGQLIEQGEAVPADIPVGSWMVAVEPEEPAKGMGRTK